MVKVELQVDVLSVVPANQEVLMHLVIENLLNGLEVSHIVNAALIEVILFLYKLGSCSQI